MKTTFFIIINFILIGCSSKPTHPSTGTYDTQRPISYSEYKKWRADNDPAGTMYAQYKKWEIAYRQWKARQEQQ